MTGEYSSSSTTCSKASDKTSSNSEECTNSSSQSNKFSPNSTTSSPPTNSKLSSDVSITRAKNKDRILSSRSQKKIQNLRKEFELRKANTSSFIVSSSRQSPNDSKFQSQANSQTNLISSPSSAKLKDSNRNFTLEQLSIAENPFAYQEFYEVGIEHGEGSSSSNFINRENSALELADVARAVRNGHSKNTSNSTNNTTDSTTENLKRGAVIETFQRDSSSSNDQMNTYQGDSFFEEDLYYPPTKIRKLRWLNFLGLIMLIGGIFALALVVLFMGIAERRKPIPPLVYEHLTDYIYPQLSAIRTSLVDPDTPKKYHHKKPTHNVGGGGEGWDLVFSDEFNAEGRTFYPKEDQFFEGVDIHYAATDDLEWYDPDAITTANGTLQIRMDAFKTNGLHYRSGMLQSWNKMCFTQGLVEISAKMPGSFHSKGFWPAAWTLGNLARPGYMASTDGTWPYTYEECDAGITPNQSSPDGLSLLPGQKLNSCTCRRQDHPNRGTGRGAPEIDILEGSFSPDLATIAQTLQMAPFDPWWLPDYDQMLIANQTTTFINSYVGGTQQEAISALTTLNQTWFEKLYNETSDHEYIPNDHSQNFQKFHIEFRSDQPRKEDNYISFGLGGKETFKITGSALHPEGNVGWREISKEPMSMVLNFGLSYAWSDIEWTTLRFPATFEIDYIRIYQPKGKHSVTCDPYGYPTVDYIKNHENAYMNPNLTSWEAAGYSFPKNRLMHGCR